MLETHPFGDFLPRKMKYLVLGSFCSKPARPDIVYDWYYANGRNHFWKILEQVYDTSLPDKAAKRALMEKLGVGIADIIYQCERSQGNSSDLNLTNIVFNPELRNIVSQLKPNKIFFTSRFVEKLYRKEFRDLVHEFPEIELVTLPSPSPRYAQLSLAQKAARYKKVLPSMLQ